MSPSKALQAKRKKQRGKKRLLNLAKQAKKLRGK